MAWSEVKIAGRKRLTLSERLDSTWRIGEYYAEDDITAVWTEV